ncbi:hint-domain-containing protein [Xylaria bambusicola]|uniref:hint-domain-containing protein n=1 Tax=Xylaria bambusicola TaxID=326684 RepID=UPI0020074FC8|nr:hint-domain-containing protein [Xylaria bambusicola]KAI0517910.1 hint-domain-containing protein [Xylaria bambusicola]
MRTKCIDPSDLGGDSINSPSTPTSTDDPITTIHPLKNKDGVIVTVQPPDKPLSPVAGHVPCDIVLVIDVSQSMSDNAPAAVYDEQGNAAKEDFGLTILDLTKHAARTIVSTLNEGDRLGIVTFNRVLSRSWAYIFGTQIIQDLTPMTEENKAQMNVSIDSMRTDGATNLWGGITEGLKLFEPGCSNGRVPALMVLTDGQPNTQCPSQGYVRKLQTMGPLPASINTFGFGYDIRSGLLKSIAETSNGNYAFIPDAGMIGTVFVHAVAHLISTYATRCTLEITATKGVLLRTTTGKRISEEQDEEEAVGRGKLTIQLDNLQYGQSRDIYLESVDEKGQKSAFTGSGEDGIMHATLRYSRMGSAEFVTFAHQDIAEPSNLGPSVIAYHQSRSMICDLLSSFAPIWNSEYVDKRLDSVQDERRRLQKVIDSIPAKDYKDKYNKSLMQDLNGQVSEALSRETYFNRWGRHFFFSLRNAHEKQLCNSFKDPGPLMYNDNKLFNEYRDNLDATFSLIPPPKPTARKRKAKAPKIFSMAKFHSQGNPCFAGSSHVLLAEGYETPISNLRQGMLVKTPVGARGVRALLKTQPSSSATMCRVENLLVTPWHPIKVDRSENEHIHGTEWVFPIDVVKSTEAYSEPVYSVLLEPHEDVDAHAIYVGGVWGVTLGHGITSGSDVRAHEFLGDYSAVSRELMTLGSGEDGVYSSAGVRRDGCTGMVCGFASPPSIYANEMKGMDRVQPYSRVETLCA